MIPSGSVFSASHTPWFQVSVLAAQIGETFEPYQTDAGDALNRLDMGTMSAAAMFESR